MYVVEYNNVAIDFLDSFYYDGDFSFDFNVCDYVSNFIDLNAHTFKESGKIVKTYIIMKLILIIVPFIISVFLQMLIHNTLIFIDKFIFMSAFNKKFNRYFRWIIILAYYILYFPLFFIDIIFCYIDYILLTVLGFLPLYLLFKII